MRTSTMIAVTLSILMISIPAIGAMEQPHLQIQYRDRVQTSIEIEEQEQARSELNKRLKIDGSSFEQMKVRAQEQAEIRFRDLETHWSRDEVEESFNWGFVNGYPDGSFRPEGIISGTEGILMLSRMMDCLNMREQEMGSENDIDWDKVPQWAREQLREETEMRIASQSQLYGESQLNRLQFSVMMAKAMGIENGAPPEGTVVFLDDEVVPPSELGYIYRLRVMGIIQGNEGDFMAQKQLTRAEATVMMNRAMNMLRAAPAEFTYDKDKLQVILHENPTTGYSWTVEFKEGDILGIDTDEFVPFAVSADVVGSGGEHTWVFVPEDEGVEEIVFSYYRSWEDKETAIDSRVLMVEVNGSLEIVDVR